MLDPFRTGAIRVLVSIFELEPTEFRTGVPTESFLVYQDQRIEPGRTRENVDVVMTRVNIVSKTARNMKE